MRLLRSASLALGVVLVAGVAVAACSAKHDPAPGEILLAIDANLNVPADMDQLGVSVMAEDGSVSATDQIYAMSPAGFVKFPATLAIVRGTSQPVDIKVAAFKGGEAFLLREVVTTLPADRTAILRVDLNWLDEGSTSGAVTKVQSLATGMPCVSGQTSIDGTCQSFTLDSDTLPTYTSGALVPTSDAGGLCLDIPDCVVGQPGAVIPTTMIPQPTLGTGTGTDADGGAPSCAIAPPAFTGDFNIGMIPKSGAAGWCNGSAGCALPLENDAAPNWPVSSVDGMVHLPLGVCTSTQIAGLLLSQVTPGCPQYGAIEHPACQGYGVDGGATPNGGGGRGGVTDDGSTGAYYSPVQESAGGSYYNVIGLAVDTTSSNDAGDVPFTFRKDNAKSTAFASEPFASSPFLNIGQPGLTVASFASTSSSFAVTSDRAAAAAPAGVDVFFLDGGAASAHYANTDTGSTTPIQVGFDQNGLLVAAGFGQGVSWFLPDGGSGLNPPFLSEQATYLAFNEPDNSFVIASTATDFDRLRSLKFEPTPTATTLPPAFALAPVGSIDAVTVADETTVVWVDVSGQFYVSSIDADAGAGTKLPVQMALYDNGVANGALALTGGGGRIAWIDGAQQHVWTMRVAHGAAANGPTDLSTIVPSGIQPVYINATTVALDPVANLLHWTQTDTGYLYGQLITRLP